ncbi:lytic murein transglycosylase [Nocardioides sp. BP30]|uniref:lytic transglycosylase domain-containing protein n=1 Tax=Nocardioides sp. BP30 TaxID=3036374 RepID=UPI002469AB94|nr:lytic transglycosylase domain-containing protein [Nocardioides sp. BP30]WGL52921.1 lytic murein transglycosylase [Nocardioides sp. BP30]
MTARFGKAQKAAALVPLAALSAAWTISLTGLGAGSAEATGTRPSTLPDGTVVPTKAIDAPATVSDPTTGADLSAGRGAQIVSTADSSGIPAAALAAYQRAATVIDKADPTCNLSWQLVAAIGRVESNHGRSGGNTLNAQGIATPGIFGPVLDGAGGTTAIADTDGGQFDGDTSYDRAVGPMQFIPSTWSVVGVDADGDGKRDPQDINDAALAAAVYLCSGEEDLGTTAGQRTAVFRYNHSQSYVDTVLGVASAYTAGDYSSVPNYTVPAAYLTPSTYLGTSSATKKHHKATGTRSHPTSTATSTPAPTATASATPKSDPSTSPKPTSKPSVPVPQVTAVTKPVQDALASATQLTQVCTQALVKDGIADPATSVPKALTACVNQLTGKTLPEAQKAVTGIIAGLGNLLGGLLDTVLGGK